jgi:predicted metal-dependent hydrolase
MSSLSHTPADIPVLPRSKQFDIDSALGRDWFDNHPFKTAWFNAMSLTFPLGEKFFIDSVRHFADQIDDPKLNADIRGFCGQEGYHRREHQRFNETLCRKREYDLHVIEGRLEKNIQRAYTFLSPLERLAATAAFEHITAILAESALSEDNPMIDTTDSAMQSLWQWHAAEEMEHKSVAFDVFKAVGGTERLRKRAMRQATFFLMLDVMMGLVHMLRKDKQLWSARLWSEGWQFLFFKGGILRRVWPAYKEYYRDGFHPWDRDTRPLLRQWQLTEDQALPG